MKRLIGTILFLILVTGQGAAQYQLNQGWSRKEGRDRWYEKETTSFFTEDSTLTDKVKELFSLSKVRLLNETSRIEVHLFNQNIGIKERDIVLFLDRDQRILFAVIITVGWLDAANKLQAMIINSPLE